MPRLGKVGWGGLCSRHHQPMRVQYILREPRESAATHTEYWEALAYYEGVGQEAGYQSHISEAIITLLLLCETLQVHSSSPILYWDCPIILHILIHLPTKPKKREQGHQFSHGGGPPPPMTLNSIFIYRVWPGYQYSFNHNSFWMTILVSLYCLDNFKTFFIHLRHFQDIPPSSYYA